jgi:hypothetical protein
MVERSPGLWINLPDGRRAMISPHAINRYVERVREASHPVALREIRALIDDHCTIGTQPPAWLHSGEWARWWLTAGDVSFTVAWHDDEKMLSVRTVLVRGWIDPDHRARLNARAAVRRARRRARAGADHRDVAREGRRARRERRGVADA